jgi:hypothetical protein
VRHPFHPLAVLSFFAACCSSANADILIDPTFDSSITSDPNAATIESAIDQAISRFESSIETPITVKIDFQETSGGLGESNSGFNEISYSQYRSDLVNNQILSANDNDCPRLSSHDFDQPGQWRPRCYSQPGKSQGCRGNRIGKQRRGI